MNTRKQGAIAVAKAIAWFTRNGYNVSIPVSETQRYDLIVERGGTCYRVEVKSTTNRDVDLRTNGGNQSGHGVSNILSTEDAELLYASTADGEFILPVFLIGGRQTIIPPQKYQCVDTTIG